MWLRLRSGETTISRSLQITESAGRDLAEIWAYIAEEASESVASRFVEKLYATRERLLHFRWGIQNAGSRSELRVVFHGAYAIYRPVADTVTIIRVLHGARDLDAIGDDGGFEY